MGLIEIFSERKLIQCTMSTFSKNLYRILIAEFSHISVIFFDKLFNLNWKILKVINNASIY